jgi:hypothetical protein
MQTEKDVFKKSTACSRFSERMIKTFRAGVDIIKT